MNTDIDKTIEKIEADLQENEQPLPKAAPTQYRLHQRPREMPLLGFQAKCQNCDYQTPHTEIRLDDPRLLAEACEHAFENKHDVQYTYTFAGSEPDNFLIACKPRAWSEKADYFWHRHGDKIIVPIGCLFIGWSLYFIFGLGVKGWQFWVHVGCLSLWGLNLVPLLWQKIKEKLRR